MWCDVHWYPCRPRVPPRCDARRLPTVTARGSTGIRRGWRHAWVDGERPVAHAGAVVTQSQPTELAGRAGSQPRQAASIACPAATYRLATGGRCKRGVSARGGRARRAAVVRRHTWLCQVRALAPYVTLTSQPAAGWRSSRQRWRQRQCGYIGKHHVRGECHCGDVTSPGEACRGSCESATRRVIVGQAAAGVCRPSQPEGRHVTGISTRAGVGGSCAAPLVSSVSWPADRPQLIGR